MTKDRDEYFWKSLQDGQNTEPFPRDIGFGTKDIDQSDTRVNIWLASTVIFFLIVVFVIIGLIIHELYYKPPVVRTALERELIKFETMVKNNPNDTEARIGLAGVYLQLNQPKKAISELNVVNRLKPHSWDTLFGLGMAHEAMNNKRLATNYFKEAASMDPVNELAFYKLGKVYLSQKHYEPAINAYQKALDINPTLADAHYYLGVCYEKTSKKKLAIDEYEEALRYVDSYPEAIKAIQRLQ